MKPPKLMGYLAIIYTPRILAKIYGFKMI